MYTVKTALVYIRIIYPYKEGPNTVQNKGALDNGIKTKTLSLALKSYLNMLYSGQFKDLLY